MPSASAPIFWTSAALVLSALLTWASIAYAHRRKLIDEPGMRRSHTVPTPRGGGIGIVVAIIACGLLPAATIAPNGFTFAWLVPPVAGVALVGWIDDHGGLSARRRFAMHCAAALWTFGLPLLTLSDATSSPSSVLPAVLAIFIILGLIATVGVVWCINLHNFMDGINGLLALQAIFVFGVLAALFWKASDHGVAAQVGLWACAVIGFVPFNFPRARVFMGDVGSGVLGFLIAVAVIMQIFSPRIAMASGLVMCSAFVTDATCTLVSRMIRGRRWYSAHREHLYQWLVRCGNSHARVVAYYMSWNALVVLPTIVWMNDSTSIGEARPPLGIEAAALVYAGAVVVWLVGKQRCIASARARGSHGAP